MSDNRECNRYVYFTAVAGQGNFFSISFADFREKSAEVCVMGLILVTCVEMKSARHLPVDENIIKMPKYLINKHWTGGKMNAI